MRDLPRSWFVLVEDDGVPLASEINRFDFQGFVLTHDSAENRVTIAGGTGAASFTAGALLFGNGTGALATDESNLFWDNTNKSLIIGEQGTESGGVNINGTVYQSALKVSDISSSNPAQLSLHRHSTTLPSVILASRSNSNTSSHGNVTNSMPLLQIYGAGSTSTSVYDLFGAIEIGVDSSGTVSSTSSPGAIKFYTAADGTNTLTERMKIANDGTVSFSGALKFGTHSAVGAETVTGYITITDSGGTSRKLAVIS